MSPTVSNRFAARRLVLALALIAAPAVAFVVGRASADHHLQHNKLYELRVYTTNEGKLDDLNTRFRDHTNRIFAKHGMEMIGYWTPTEGDKAGNTLIYILAYPDLAARTKAWDDFRQDPEWTAAFTASRADGPLVKGVESTLMSPTDYSPIK